MHKNRIIAIDGPAGSGKSTTARLVARRLGFTYLDTGALYRALTHVALERGVDLADGDALAALMRDIRIRIASEADRTRIWVDGKEVSDAIRRPEVSRRVSQVAAHPQVRAAMVQLQRRIAREGDFVVEGRDIGTVVFPHADLKIFLTASLEARAERRWRELQEKGVPVKRAELRREIAERDRWDSERETAPLTRAEDAIVVDTTRLSIEEQVEKIVRLFEQVAATDLPENLDPASG